MIINNNDTPDVSRLNLDQANLNKTQGSARRRRSFQRGRYLRQHPGDDSISLSNSPNLVQQALASSSSERSARVQELKALVAKQSVPAGCPRSQQRVD